MLATELRAVNAQASTAGRIASERQRAASFGGMRLAIGTTPDLSGAAVTADAANRSCVVIEPNQTAYLAALKAANPTVKVLAYKDFGGMKSTTFSDGSYSSGVLLGNADPSWILKGVDGTTPCIFTFFNTITAADVANTAYIDAWDASAGAEAASRGFDGIFLDDVNPRLQTTPASATYPDNASYQAAVLAGITRLAPKLHARGLWLLPNIGSWHDGTITGAVSNGDAIAAQCNAGFHENWTSFGIPPTLQGRLSDDNMLTSAQTLQKNGGWHACTSHGASTDTAIAHMALAMKLLVAYGYQRSLTGMMSDTAYQALPVDHAADPTGYANAALIGTPTEDATQTTSHVWRRTFTNGQVWVNTDTSTHAVVFGGTYSGDGLTSQTGTTLAVQSALILTAG